MIRIRTDSLNDSLKTHGINIYHTIRIMVLRNKHAFRIIYPIIPSVVASYRKQTLNL